jgi:hypothetical protein
LRNRVERYFNKFKHFRRIATRYDKLAESFLATLKFASFRIWLRSLDGGIPGHRKVYPRDVELVFPVAGRDRPRKRARAQCPLRRR